MSAPDRKKLLDRVRRLYAMSNDEGSPHEAEIALRRCNALMAKYGITEADLETSAFGAAAVGGARKSTPMHEKIIGSAVATLHDCLFVTGAGREFRGYEVDAEVASLTHDYLLGACDRSLRAAKKRGEVIGRSAVYDYRVGYAAEVHKRVSRIMDARRAEQAAAPGTSLVVRKREIVERECGKDLRGATVRPRGVRDGQAWKAGQRDGRAVSLDSQLGGRAPHGALA